MEPSDDRTPFKLFISNGTYGYKTTSGTFVAFRGDSTATYTYATNSTGSTVDLGAKNNYRYVNATNVYNKGKADGVTTHTTTYTFAANDTGGTKDLGTSHTYRYVNATNVYEYGAVEALKGNVGNGVPTMTSATTPSGMAFSSSNFSGQPEWQAFDKNKNTTWSNKENAVVGVYIGYMFPTAHKCLFAKFDQRVTTNWDGRCTAKYQGSNNGTNYTDLTETLSFDQLCSSATTAPLIHIFTKNVAFYKYYRLYYLSKVDKNLNPTCAGIDFIYLQ